MGVALDRETFANGGLRPILYGVIAQQSSLDTPVNIDELFLAGILPGLLMVVLLSGWSMFKQPKGQLTTSLDIKE